MGLFDGTPSAAELATQLGMPILAVIDGASMANSFGAIAYGLKHYRPGTPVNAAFANCVGSAYHAELLERACRPTSPGTATCRATSTRRCPSATSACCRPPRSTASRSASSTWPICWRRRRREPAAAVEFDDVPAAGLPTCWQDVAIARDAAFCFLYPANLDCLERPAQRSRISRRWLMPLLPECDAVLVAGRLPGTAWPGAGGESFAVAFARRARRRGSRGARRVRRHDGFVRDADGCRWNEHRLAGLLPGQVRMQKSSPGLACRKSSCPKALRGTPSTIQRRKRR